MIILPAIDLINKKPVRLYKGRFDTAHIVAQDAVETARSFYEAGARHLHIVDLDGAKSGSPKNLDVVAEIAKNTKASIEFGGGVRDMKTIEKVFETGVFRVILGSVALKNKQLVVDAVKQYGKRIAVGIDAKDGRVRTHGWVEDSMMDYIELAKRMEDVGVGVIIFTDIGRDGTLGHPNFKQLTNLKDAVSCDIIASGGVCDSDDIRVLKGMGLYGAIAGKAVYTGDLNLAEALKIAHDGPSCALERLDIFFEKAELIPAIITEHGTGDVLMLAYMNRESLSRTILTGTTWFWSRSRGKLWNKGESSGNIQQVKVIYYDCDLDTLKIEVVQTGNACHTGNKSCFYRTFWRNEDAI